MDWCQHFGIIKGKQIFLLFQMELDQVIFGLQVQQVRALSQTKSGKDH